MSRNTDWLKLLPNTITCNACQKVLNAPFWRESSNGVHTIALNFVQCSCGNTNIGAAGIDRESLEVAMSIRRQTINACNAVTKH